jgi:hypothetical protein
MPLMASTCVFPPPLGVLTMLNLPLFRWEFFTTLDYEWSVIRGRRPYRWTIWVSGDGLFFGVSLTLRTELSPSLGLFLYADSHPCGSNPQHCRV